MTKKQKEKKKYQQIYKLYEVKGEKAERKNSNCPKCGPGIFLGLHSNRVTCGKCGYTEFKKK